MLWHMFYPGSKNVNMNFESFGRNISTPSIDQLIGGGRDQFYLVTERWPYKPTYWTKRKAMAP